MRWIFRWLTRVCTGYVMGQVLGNLLGRFYERNAWYAQGNSGKPHPRGFGEGRRGSAVHPVDAEAQADEAGTAA